MFHENLTALRKHLGLSQEELAERIGVTRQTLSKWENGESSPDIEKSKQLADVLNVSLDDLASYEMESTHLPVPPKGKYMFGVVKVGDKGQIVIPARARKVFGINVGDSLIVLGDETRGLALLQERDFMNLVEQIGRAHGEDL